MKIKNGKILADIINQLMFTWSSDAPPEAFWILNDLIDFINKEYDLKEPYPFEGEDTEDLTKFESLISFLESDSCN